MSYATANQISCSYSRCFSGTGHGCRPSQCGVSLPDRSDDHRQGCGHRVSPINPHARIYFEVTGEDGTAQSWLGEGNASLLLKRRGWKDDTLKPGDVITISGSPARDGGHKIDWESIVLEDGTELGGGNTKAGERERQLRDLDKKRRRLES